VATGDSALPKTAFRATGPSYLATIAIGHGLKHWYLSAFAVFLPLIEAEYGLTTLGVSVLVTIRQFAGGAPNFFVGYITDRLSNYWNLLLPASLLSAAVFMMLAGLSHWYWAMVAFLALTGIAASLWHPAAISMLSTRFPDRRGMAIAIHGSGSGAGEALGPLGVGLILAVLLADDWRLYVVLSVVPAIGFTLLLYWMLIGAGPYQRPERTEPPKLTDVFRLLRYPVYRTLAYANFTRSLTHFGLLSFLPLYLARDLGMDSLGVGFHVALLTLLGVGTGPLLGYLSDRIGRRVPIIVSMIVITIGMFMMGIVGSGIGLAVALAITGIFLWSVQDLINATAMDAAPAGSQGSVVGLMFSSSLVSATVAPAIMGIAVNLTDTRRAIFFVAGAVVIPALFILPFAPMKRAEPAPV
jgi:sugar phosphate permease